MKIYYNENLKKIASKLRNNMTYAEKCMWIMLRNKQIFRFDFHRQKPIGNFIADFYCHKLKLVIEIDGISHNDENVKINDDLKQKYFENIGLVVMRFTDDEVIGNSRIIESKIRDFAQLKPHIP